MKLCSPVGSYWADKFDILLLCEIDDSIGASSIARKVSQMRIGVDFCEIRIDEFFNSPLDM